jgi:hypothetical protein
VSPAAGGFQARPDCQQSTSSVSQRADRMQHVARLPPPALAARLNGGRASGVGSVVAFNRRVAARVMTGNGPSRRFTNGPGGWPDRIPRCPRSYAMSDSDRATCVLALLYQPRLRHLAPFSIETPVERSRADLRRPLLSAERQLALGCAGVGLRSGADIYGSKQTPCDISTTNSHFELTDKAMSGCPGRIGAGDADAGSGVRPARRRSETL